MLLGTGLVGGIYRNNGRLTALLEAQALGYGHLFDLMDQAARHRGVEFPGHHHGALYDVNQMEPMVRSRLAKAGVEIRCHSRAVDVAMTGDCVDGVVLDSGETIRADVFVETTGSAGPMTNCGRFGNGCAMCVIRCPAFGPRVSLAAKAGVMEVMGVRPDGQPGSMSGSCKLEKSSLSNDLRRQLEASGVLVLPLPSHLHHGGLDNKACQQYNLPAFKENLILLDTGHAKLMAPYFPLERLRAVPGLENARYADPYAGGLGNSIRFTSVTPRDNQLKVDGVENLYCAGEKAGFLVGHTEAVITGSLAGRNAAAHALGKEPLTLPDTLACGDLIAFSNPVRKNKKARVARITFSGAAFFERMQKNGQYLTDGNIVARRVRDAGLLQIFAENK
jgi:hypothetical protein